jgi:glycosyltransferase involved in cell wall biosynthesis
MNSKAKNQQVFLRAAATIVRKFSNAQFVLVGDGPLRQDLERLTDDLGLRKNVIFLGERLDIPAVLAAMDGSVVASSSESLSNVILESMAAGVPVVATDIPGNREVVKAGNTGILVASGSVTELVAALEQLLSYPSLRQALSARAKRYAKETYNFDCVRQQYEDLYAQLNSAKAVKNP